MAVNMRKYRCIVSTCGRTANVHTDDGFVAVMHCEPCTRSGPVRRHIKRYFALVTPIAQIQKGWDNDHGTLI